MSKIGELFKLANVNDDGTSKRLTNVDFLASAREIWEQTLPEGITVEIAEAVHKHDHDFSQKLARALTANTYTNGKDPKFHITSCFDATEVLELPGELSIRVNVFSVKTPEMNYLAGYAEYQAPKMQYTETVIDKNHPVDIWDF